jgi:DNA topoisomerase-1
MAPDELTVEAALEILSHAAESEKPLGHCPQTGKPVYLKMGRFGPYVQMGDPQGDEKPKNASLVKGMRREDVTLEVALKLLALPRELGPHPQSGLPVVAYNGRFGPYLKCGEETRSLPSSISPLDVTLEQAIEILAQPKAARRGFGAPREPVKVLDESPVTKQKIQLLEGRYGLYLTDGATNASLPKGMSPDELTQETALALLAARAALGPAKKSARRRSGPPKRAAKAAKKSAADNGRGESPLKKGAKKKTAGTRAAAKRL